MLQLRLDDLSVASFDATPNDRVHVGVNGITRDTEQVACFSPLCGPTHWRTCDPCQPEPPTVPDTPVVPATSEPVSFP